MHFKYSYPNLERVEENEMRFYKDSNNDLVPSVTTVLDATGDKSGITQWRRKVGPAQADAIVQESTLIGSAVHEGIENYLLGKSWNNFTEDRNRFLEKSISSNSAIRGYAFNSIYAAAKAAVNNLTQSVAKELSGRKVRVNAISPGTINTPGVQDYFKAEPNAKKYLESLVLLERIGEPEDIGDAVVFLLSKKSNYITGQIISVDGGSAIN